MKLALIQCPLWGTYDPPLALAQLSSCLKQAGHQVYIFDLNIKLYLERGEKFKNVWAWEQSDFWFNQNSIRKALDSGNAQIDYCLSEIISKDIRIVGFSVNATSELFSMELSRRLKDINKDIVIVWGGPFFFRKSSIESVLASGVVDVVVPGEGENSFKEFLETLKHSRDFSKSPGIAFKKNGQIYQTPSSQPVVLEQLPFLDFSHLPLEDYDDFEHIPMMTTRGCIRRCVFCSDMPCWPIFKSMSGRRIFAEIVYQKNVQLTQFNRKISHVDFLDLVFNGNMNSLIEFCNLMIEADLDLEWSANMCVRPELTGAVIDKMGKARCEHVLIGIESGSERTLRLMNKYYKISDAERIIRQMSKGGICVTTNFMFGFPQETEEDFQETLDFLKRNARFLSRVYPSRTYCALEEFSYLESHLEEFGVKPNPVNHLFWESADGTNTYPLRMERCRRFCKLAQELGVEVGAGVQTTVQLDEWFNLGHYYEVRKDYIRAIENYLNYYRSEPKSENVNRKLQDYLKRIDTGEFSVDTNLKLQLKECINEIKSEKGNLALSCVNRLKAEDSSGIAKAKLKRLLDTASKQDDSLLNLKPFQDDWSKIKAYINKFFARRKDKDVDELIKLYAQTMRVLASKNKSLNGRELKQRKVDLVSYPSVVSFQIVAPKHSFCIFGTNCSKNKYFSLSYFQQQIEPKINYGLGLAEHLFFNTNDELLLLPNWQEILDYFNFHYPHIQKVIFTDGASLRTEVSDVIVAYHSHYVINIRLFASNGKLHKLITRENNFEKIMEQLRYLLSVRKNKSNIQVNLVFIASTITIEDLGNFVRLASKMGVDKVIVHYNRIHSPTQKYLSCFFKQPLTNRIFDDVEKLTKTLNIEIDLPPRFNVDGYRDTVLCQELWSQIKFNGKGCLLTCAGQVIEDLTLDNYNYLQLWNSHYYRAIRRQFLENVEAKCLASCYRMNPESINRFITHVCPNNNGENIDLLWGDNF